MTDRIPSPDTFQLDPRVAQELSRLRSEDNNNNNNTASGDANDTKQAFQLDPIVAAELSRMRAEGVFDQQQEQQQQQPSDGVISPFPTDPLIWQEISRPDFREAMQNQLLQQGRHFNAAQMAENLSRPTSVPSNASGSGFGLPPHRAGSGYEHAAFGTPGSGMMAMATVRNGGPAQHEGNGQHQSHGASPATPQPAFLALPQPTATPPTLTQLFSAYQTPVSHPDADIYFLDRHGLYIDDTPRASPNAVKATILQFCHTTHVKPADSSRHRLVAVNPNLNIENVRWIVAQAKHYGKTNVADKPREYLADKPALLDLMKEMHAAIEVGELIVPMELVVAECDMAREFGKRRYEAVAARLSEGQGKEGQLKELEEMSLARLVLADANVSIGRARVLSGTGTPMRMVLSQFDGCEFDLWYHIVGHGQGPLLQIKARTAIVLRQPTGRVPEEVLELRLDSKAGRFMTLELNSDSPLDELKSVTGERGTTEREFDTPLSIPMHFTTTNLESLNAEDTAWARSLVVELNIASDANGGVFMKFKMPSLLLDADSSKKKSVVCWGRRSDRECGS